ncbi:hypothetical protein DFJ73DRAFT_827532 [Zopfochytrium polystomum]|nr:hypothetical protein DFJ73DRAFT_827532 [Zopfochytrium polystomum]
MDYPFADRASVSLNVLNAFLSAYNPPTSANLPPPSSTRSFGSDGKNHAAAAASAGSDQVQPLHQRHGSTGSGLVNGGQSENSVSAGHHNRQSPPESRSAPGSVDLREQSPQSQHHHHHQHHQQHHQQHQPLSLAEHEWGTGGGGVSSHHHHHHHSRNHSQQQQQQPPPPPPPGYSDR